MSWSDDGAGADITRYLGVVGTVLYHLIDGNQFRSRATSGSWVQTDYSTLGVEDIEHTIVATIEASDGLVVFFGNGECTKITAGGYTVCDFEAPMQLVGATGLEAGGNYYLVGIEVSDDGEATTYTERAYYLDPNNDTKFTEIPLAVGGGGLPCYPAIVTAGVADVPLFSLYEYDHTNKKYELKIQRIDNHLLGVSISAANDTDTLKVCKPRRVDDHAVYAGTSGIVTYNPDEDISTETRYTHPVLAHLTAFGDYGAAGTVAAYCANTAIYSDDGEAWTLYSSAVGADEAIATITIPPQAATDVDDFLLRITHEQLPDEFFDRVVALSMTRANFRAEDSVGGAIPVMCIKLDANNYEGYFYIKVPTVSSTVNTVIKLIASYDVPLTADPFTGTPYNLVVDFEAKQYRNLCDDEPLTEYYEFLNGADFGSGQGAVAVVTDPFDGAVGAYMSAACSPVGNITDKFLLVQTSSTTSTSNRTSLYTNGFENFYAGSSDAGNTEFNNTMYDSKGIIEAVGIRETPAARDVFYNGASVLSDVGHTTTESRQIIMIGMWLLPFNQRQWYGDIYEVRTMNVLPSDDYVYLEQAMYTKRLSLTVEVDDELAAVLGKKGRASLERDENIGAWVDEIGTSQDNQLSADPEASLIGGSQLGGSTEVEVKTAQSLDGNVYIPAAELLAGDIEVTVHWYQTSRASDAGELAAMGIRFLDGGGSTLLETVDTMLYEAPANFTLREFSLQAPAGTEEVELIARFTGGSGTDKYGLIDGIEVSWIYNG